MAFWICAALMLLAAMAFLLRPLVGTRGDARREALLRAHRSGALDADELAAKLAALGPDTHPPTPRTAVAAVVLLLPLLAVFSYRLIGEPRALDPAQIAAPATTSAGDAAQAPDMDSAVASLAERLQTNPDDLDGWVLLGRAYKAMERFEPAREAFANARRLAPDDAEIMIEYAESLVLASDTRRFEGEALDLLRQALERQPASQRGLWLLGVSHYQKDDFAGAVAAWDRLIAVMPADAPARAALLERAAEARTRGGLPAATPSPPATAADTAPPAAGSARLTVQVDIAPALKAKLAPDDVLFVFARAASGPRMPLAIQRLPASALPTTITLDDSTSMMPSMTLSSQPQVVVGARISKTGDAIAKPGDFETLSAPLPNTQAAPVVLVIDTVVP